MLIHAMKCTAYFLAVLLLIPAAYLANLATTDGMAWGAFSVVITATSVCLLSSICLAVFGRMLYWKDRAQYFEQEWQWCSDQHQVAVQMR